MYNMRKGSDGSVKKALFTERNKTMRNLIAAIAAATGIAAGALADYDRQGRRNGGYAA